MNWLEKLIAKVMVRKIVKALDSIKKLKGWRTVVYFIFSLGLYLLAWPELTKYIEPRWIATGTALVGIVLRVITTTPVGKK